MDAGTWTGLAAAAGLEKSVVTLSNEARLAMQVKIGAAATAVAALVGR
jgi:hypothetical protein